MKEGAYDYLTKPVDIQRLKILLDKIVERQETLREVKSLRRQLREHGTFGTMIGNSPEMRKIYQVIEQAAPTSASVLITVESGTGKEIVAQTIHQLSPRGTFPFVAINCAAIPETLLERDLRPRERAFTGAADRRQGCFELADRGTLFPRRDRRNDADDAGEAAARAPGRRFPPSRRPERSRSSMSGCSRPPTSTRSKPSEGQAARGSLLPVERVLVPAAAAAQRREDLPLLIHAFINEFNTRNQKSVAAVDHLAMRMLEQYLWPGNVRELRNVIERATILATGQFIEPRHLPPVLTNEPAPEHQPQLSLGPGTTVEEAERRLILMTLEHTRDNKTRAAEILGISLKTLHNKLNKLRLRPNKKE
jgi:DNA-binding NtrC family response regulator